MRFDWDADEDVDQDDFARFQQCYTGEGDPDGLYDHDACRCMNSDRLSEPVLDIDQYDFEAFHACASGPVVDAAVECDDLLDLP